MSFRSALIAPTVLVLCVACGGGGGPETQPPATDPPASSPPPGTPPPTYTVGGTVIGLRGSGLALRDGNSPLPVTSDGTFTFPDALASGASYSISVQTQPSNATQVCTVTNGTGTVTTANITNVTVSCTTPEANRSWLTPTQIHQDDADAEQGARLASNTHGTAVLIWRQNVSNVVRIFASRYTPESRQWSAPTIVGSQGGPEPLSVEAVPQIATTDNGNATAVWPQLVNGTYEIWASAYTDSSGWSTAVRIDTAMATADYSQVVYDSNGNGLVTWQQLDGASCHVYYSRLSAGATAWSAPVRIDAAGGSARNPQMAADAHGNVTVVWSENDSVQAGSIFHIGSTTYTSSTGSWTAPRVISSAPTLNAFLAKVVSNAAGVAEAMWLQDDNSIWSNQYLPASGWGTAQLLEAGGNGNQQPQMAIDQNGNVLAVWERSEIGTAQSHMRYATLPAGGGNWSASAVISASDANAVENVEVPQVGFDTQGNALAMWSRAGAGGINERSAVYTPRTGWSAPAGVGNNTDADDAVLMVMPNGNAIAAWQQRVNGATTLWANFFE